MEKWDVDEVKNLFTQGLFLINKLWDIEKVIEYTNKNIPVRA